MPTRLNNINEWKGQGVLRSFRDDEGNWVHETMTAEENRLLWKERFTYPDRQLYDVCYYRSNPFGYHDEPFTPHVIAEPSEEHVVEYPHRCHIGVDICARVLADTEEEAKTEFWRLYEMVDRSLLD